MRFIHLYLIGYFVLVVGAILALWQAGALARISGTWIAIGMMYGQLARRPGTGGS